MFKFKATLIALAITFLLLAGFVNSSDAFEIEEMIPDDYFRRYYANDLGYGATHRVRVKTSHPYYCVDWYVDDAFHSSSYNNNDYTLIRAYAKITGLTGSLSGTIYTIKAITYEWDGAMSSTSDTDSYEVTVYKPIYTYDVDGKADPDIPEVSGYSEISRYYRSGDIIILDYDAYLFYHGNDNKKKFKVWTEIKNTIHDLDYPETGKIGTLDKDEPCFTDSGTISASLSRGETGEKYLCEAYVRIAARDGRNEDHYYRNHRVWYKK